MFVRSFVRTSFSGVELTTVCISFLSGVYLRNYLESIHYWKIVTPLELWHSLHDPKHPVPCPGVGIEVKILNTLKSVFTKFVMESP